MAGSPDDHAAALRTVRLLAVALVAVVVGGLVFGITRLLDSDDSPRAGQSATPNDDPVLGGEPSAAIGPESGVEIAEYVSPVRAALDDADGSHVAVVSLTEYRSVSDAASMTNAPDVELLALLVALPGASPGVVEPGDVERFVESQVDAARDEHAAIEELLPTVTDPEFEAFYRDELERFDRTVQAADPRGPIVFGFVVRAGADVLRELASSDGVRLVDVGGDDADPLDVRGLRPEERVRAGEPEFRP